MNYYRCTCGASGNVHGADGGGAAAAHKLAHGGRCGWSMRNARVGSFISRGFAAHPVTQSVITTLPSWSTCGLHILRRIGKQGLGTRLCAPSKGRSLHLFFIIHTGTSDHVRLHQIA